MLRFGNNYSLEQFSGRLREREISTAHIEKRVYWSDSSLSPHVGESKYTWKKIKLAIEFKAYGSQYDIESARADLLNYFDGKYISFTDIPGWRFFVVLEGDPEISDNYNGRYQTVTYNLLGYMESENENITIITGGIGSVIGVNNFTDAPAKLEVSGANKVTVNLGGDIFVIDNIGAGTVLIGEGKVLKNGVNHWGFVEMGKFPHVKQGVTNVTVTPTTAIVKVMFRGRFI